MSDAFVTLVAIQPTVARLSRVEWEGQPAIEQQGGGAYEEIQREPAGAKGTGRADDVAYYPPLPPPTGLAAAAVGSAITLSWDEEEGAHHYTVLWTVDPTVDPRFWDRFDTEPAPEPPPGGDPAPAPTGAQLEGLAPGSYWFSVYGVNQESKNGQNANAVEATVLSGAPEDAPGTVVAFPGFGLATGIGFVWWSELSGATQGYAVYVSGSSGQGRTGARYAAAHPPLGLSGLSGAAFVTVAAVNATGEGPLSPEATLTPYAPLALANVSAPPRGALALLATGGDGFYSYSFVANNSGATLSSGGSYIAGPTPSVTDTVRVTDSAGRTATASVTVGAGVAIAGAASAPPRGGVQLSASGGSGTGFTWNVSLNNSGGNVTAGGLYTAGATPSVSDTVLATDSLGNSATVTIAVGVGVSVTSAGTSPPRGSIALTASGGSGTGFLWSFVTNNSGGSIAGSTYTAGATPSVSDTVQAVDSLGNVATKAIAVGLGVAVSPAAPNVNLGQTQQFSASGGSGAGYVFSLSVNNSGGSTTSGGLYTAGATPATDTIAVVDSLGNTASTSAVAIAPPLVIAPAAPSVASGATQQFTASGGSGTGYVFSLLANLSGGSITSGGLYTAGATFGVSDVVQLADSLGGTATTNVSVIAAMLIPVDANSVAHVYVKNGALVDLKGNAWAKRGVGPTMNAAASVFGKAVESMGPFSDANYFSLQTFFDDYSTNQLANTARYSSVVGAGGTWTVDTALKRLKAPATAGYPQVWPNVPDMQDGFIEVTLRPQVSTATPVYIHFRYIDGLNYIRCDIVNNTLSIGEQKAGAWTWPASNQTISQTADVAHTLRLTWSGTTVTATWDGANIGVGTFTLSRSTIGTVMLQIGPGNEVDFENLSVGSTDVLDFQPLLVADGFRTNTSPLYSAASHIASIAYDATGGNPVGRLKVTATAGSWWGFAYRNDIPDLADVSMQCDIASSVQYDDMGLIVRYIDANNYLFVFNNYNALTLNKVVAGIQTQLGSTYNTGTTDCRTWRTIRVDLIGDTAAVYFNGTQRITVASGLGVAGAGKTGFATYGYPNTLSIDKLTISRAPQDFTITAIVAGNTGTAPAVFCNKTATAGYHISYYAPAGGMNYWAAGGTGLYPGGVAADATTPHVFSFGKAGSNYFAKLDGNSTQSNATAGSFTPAIIGAALLGRDPLAGSPWTGKIWEMRFTTTTPSAAVLDALHNTIIDGSYVLKDANTVALWQFESTGAAGVVMADDCGAVPLTVTSATGTVDSGTRFNAYANGTGYALSASLSTAVQNVLKADFTIEGWFKPSTTQSNSYPQPFSIDSGGPSNNWHRLIVDLSNYYPNKRGFIYNTLDSVLGSTQIDCGSTNSVIELGVWTHFALRRKSIGGGKFQADLFVNGIQYATTSNLNAISAPGTPKIAIGADTPNNATLKLPGSYDTTRLSNKYRSDAEIQAFYQNTGANALGAPPLVIPSDASEVSHVYVQNGLLRDTKANAWTKVGTPTFNAAAALGFPNGKSAESIGGFTTANYFELSNAVDAFDTLFQGDYVLTLILKGGFTGGVQKAILDNEGSDWSAKGWILTWNHSSWPNEVRIGCGGSASPAYYGSGFYPNGNTATHVISVARSGANILWKIDGVAVVTVPFTTTPVGSPLAKMRIGMNNIATYQPFSGGTVYELRAVAKTVTAADLDALHTAIGVPADGWVENFNDSSIDAARWGTITSGGGTVVEGSSGITCTSVTAGVAFVYYKNPFVRGTVRTFTVDHVVNESNWLFFGIWAGSTTPSATGDGAMRANYVLQSQQYANHNLFNYRNAAGNWTDPTPITDVLATTGSGIAIRVKFEATAAQWRITHILLSNMSVIMDTGWVNWSSTWNPAGNWYVLWGDIANDQWPTDASTAIHTVTRFEQA